MTEPIYPSLPGLQPEVGVSPVWETTVLGAVNGSETTIAKWPWPRWQYTLSYEVLRSGAAFAERQKLMAFFNSVGRGRFGEFLYLDEEDNACTNQVFGVTDGVTKTFQLTRQIQTWIEPVWAPAPDIVVKRGEATLVAGTDYTVSSKGLVTLAAAGAAGDSLSWTGTYYMRVRFDTDSAPFTRFLQGLWKTGSITLLSKVYP